MSLAAWAYSTPAGQQYLVLFLTKVCACDLWLFLAHRSLMRIKESGHWSPCTWFLYILIFFCAQSYFWRIISKGYSPEAGFSEKQKIGSKRNLCQTVHLGTSWTEARGRSSCFPLLAEQGLSDGRGTAGFPSTAPQIAEGWCAACQHRQSQGRRMLLCAAVNHSTVPQENQPEEGLLESWLEITWQVLHSYVGLRFRFKANFTLIWVSLSNG